MLRHSSDISDLIQRYHQRVLTERVFRPGPILLPLDVHACRREESCSYVAQKHSLNPVQTVWYRLSAPIELCRYALRIMSPLRHALDATSPVILQLGTVTAVLPMESIGTVVASFTQRLVKNLRLSVRRREYGTILAGKSRRRSDAILDLRFVSSFCLCWRGYLPGAT